MKATWISTLLCILQATLLNPALFAGDEAYPLGPDSQRQDGVPRGEVTEHTWKSQVFAGTIRRYWVYVPKQYDGKTAAALMVFQDGHAYVGESGQFRAPIVFDNLIHRGDLPVTIGLFIDPGHKRDKLPEKPGWSPRPQNRSLEYDTLSADYSEFLTKELIPELEKSYKISADPEDRAICGISSGGICAWTVAWERPDVFRKVLSHVGSFTDIRGGHVYPALIRKSARKPIRVFLQGGSGDLDNRFGNWPLANQQMASALRYAGYDHRFVFGEGGHSGAHGGAILPDSLRWLWRDRVAFPAPKSRVVFLGDSITHAGHFVAMVDAHFRSQSSGRAFECINIGLPSETACGLSEPDHPFPRPNVHERLDRALERTKPDIVVACYGMNDGIYYPFSNERFATYRKGIETLIDKVQASGARLVLMTPGPFDPLPLRKKGKLLPKTAKKFAWFGIYENYDKEVIARYSKWILGLRGRVEMVVDLRTPILKHVTEKRKENADYALSNDGVHVDKRGHRLIADALLRSWGETPVKPDAEIFKKAEQREVLLRYAWISHVEHLRPGVKKGLPLEEALKRAKELE